MSDGTYYWRVRGHNTSGGCNVYGSWSNAWSVAIDVTPPSVPNPSSPSNGSTTNDSTPTFDWTSSSGATQYQLQVDNNSNFSSPEINDTTTSSIYTPGSSLSDGTYYWRVRARDAVGNWSGWSSVWSLTINTAPVPYGCDPNTVALWHLNEGGGSTAQDACGVHPGTLSQTYSWIGGRHGNAVQFGAIGSQGKMTAPSSSRMNNMTNFTVEFWINRNCASTNDQIMGKSGPGAESWIIRMSDRRIEAEVYWNGGSTRLSSNTQLGCNTWYQVAVTYDGSNVRIYIHGALDKSAANSNGVRFTTSPFWIANSGLVAGIDEVRISDVSRTSFPAP
ncbi:MAG: LamG-like jellyroll fold domain-containing protein [Anaerolineales bacterium]